MKQIAPNVYKLSGIPPNAINIYLAGDVLIDAGTRIARARILRQTADRPLSLLALTHAHPDHQGAAKAVCEARNIPLACHADDVDAIEGRRPIQEASPQHPVNRIIAKIWTGPDCTVDRVLNDGDAVGDFTVIHAPGHQRGSVIFFRESDRVAICGDVIRNVNFFTGLPKLAEPPDIFTLDKAQNRSSIRRLAELHPSVVCPGHGPPLRDPDKLKAFAAAL